MSLINKIKYFFKQKTKFNTLIYLMFGIIWILSSDNVIILLGWDEIIHQTIKGIFYVAITGILLYTLLRKNELAYIKIIEELDETKSNLDSILNSLDDIIWSVKLDFNEFLFLSKTCQRVYGYRQEEFIKQPNLWMDLVYEDDRELVNANLKKIYSVGTILSIHRAYNKQNQIIWVQNKAWLVRDNKGELIRIDGVTTNITKQKNDEIKIQELYEDYKFLFENNPNPVLLVNIDNLNIEKFNRVANTTFVFEEKSLAKDINSPHFTNFKNLIVDYSQLNLITKLQDENITYTDYGIWNLKSQNNGNIKGQVFAYNLLETSNTRSKNYKIVVINNITEQYSKYLEIESKNQSLIYYLQHLSNNIVHLNNNFQVIYSNYDSINQLNLTVENFIIQHILPLKSEILKKIKSSNQYEFVFKLHNIEPINKDSQVNEEIIDVSQNQNLQKYDFEIKITKLQINENNNGYFIIINEITQFESLKNENISMNEKLIGIYNATANFHILFDTECKVLWYNRKVNDTFFAFSQKKLEYGVSFYEYYDGKDTTRFVGAFEKALSGEVVNYQIKYKFPLVDKEIWLDVTFLPVFIDNELHSVSLKLIEITEKMNKEEEILQLNKDLEEKILIRTTELEKLNVEKDEILSLAAHDLKNPLSTILLQTSIIKKYYQNQQFEKIDDKLTDIESTVSRMSDLITNLLELNRLETGKFRLYPDLVNISELIDEEIHRYESYYNSKNIEIETNLEEDVLTTVDPYVFTQIFDNIFTNAIKYSPLNSKIEICLEIKENQIYFSVQDFGSGISKAEKKLLFKKFTKLSSIPTAGENSSGLGLSIVKKYIDLIKGDIECVSEIGFGTKFIVTIPLILE